MKSTPTRKPPRLPSALADPAAPPTEARLKSTLGASRVVLDRLVAALRTARPAIAWEWKYSNPPGWYRICVLKKRRLFYLLPLAGGFRLSLIVGDRALADLAAGPHAATVQRLLKTAPRYPEGTGFYLMAEDLDTPVVLALIAAKLAI